MFDSIYAIKCHLILLMSYFYILAYYLSQRHYVR